MYFYKDIPVHGLIYLLYVGLAVVGYLRWQQNLRKERGQA
jgi:hypothetical protein